MTDDVDPISEAGAILRRKTSMVASAAGAVALVLAEVERRRSKCPTPEPSAPDKKPTPASTAEPATPGRRARPHPGRPVLPLPSGPVTGGALVRPDRQPRHDVDLADRLRKDWPHHADKLVTCVGWPGLEDRLLRLRRRGADPVAVLNAIPVTHWGQITQPAKFASWVIDEALRQAAAENNHAQVVPTSVAFHMRQHRPGRPHPGPSRIPITAANPRQAIER